ncbi:MAG: DUF434 domain-containing protein [Planctomycetota bacterium]
MPDRRRHRGPHPDDIRLFGPDRGPVLRQAVRDLSLLLSRGYADNAATKLVGDRFQLTERQRIAVRRCACSDVQRRRRARTRVELEDLAGQAVAVDGFNVLVTIEAALAGGVLLRGRDGCLRDMASMHGSWRRVAETTAAVAHVVALLARVRPKHTTFVFDRPVCNSGRLAAVVRAAVARSSLACDVELSDTADRDLLSSAATIATADAGVLDRAARWCDLAGPVVADTVPNPWLVDCTASGSRKASGSGGAS